MRIKLTLIKRAPLLLLLLTINSQLSALFAQGTAFTYQGRLNDGANLANGNYDLTFALFSTSTWAGVVIAGAPAGRTGHAAVWTGREMLVWGGVGGALVSPVVLSSGGRYNPAANTWAGLPPLNAPAGRMDHRAVWTGDEMLVWGGTDLTTELNSGGRYNRTANTWSAISINDAPSPRTGHTAVWDGTRMIVWGGFSGEAFFRNGGIYNPLTDGWLPTLENTNAPPARALHAAVWTGTEMVVHGGYNSNTSFTTYLDDIWHYTPPRTMFLYLKP